MVLAGSAFGQVRSADVLYTYHESTPQQGYRLGDECFVALDTVQTWGWNTKTDGDMVDVQAEGHSFKASPRYVAGKLMIPLRQAIEKLGGGSDWTTGTDTLNIYSTLTDLSVRDLRLHAGSHLAFKPFPFFLNPGRTVVDLDGVRLGSDTRQELGPGVRVSQYRPNVVRVTINTDFVPKLSDSARSETNDLVMEITKDSDDGSTVIHQGPPPSDPVTKQTAQVIHPTVITPPPPPVQPVQTQPTQVNTGGPMTITVPVDNENTTVLAVNLQRPFAGQATVGKPDPDTLEVSLPGVLAQADPYMRVTTSAVESVTTQAAAGGMKLIFHLARPMGSEVVSNANGVTVTLIKPNVGNGRLAGKIIVVDPGHGDHDRGCHYGNLSEKDLTLSMGLKLGAKLAAAGANVIMTRQTDVFIPLMTRSIISNQNHANLFISCHINSTGDGGSTGQSGTIVFHHINNRVAQVLAECIQHEIAKVNGLPSIGPWSDGKIYTTGFSVLRHTYAPAVLIEMGFINNARDRARMVTEDFQDSVTTAIVKGVRVFLGDMKPNE